MNPVHQQLLLRKKKAASIASGGASLWDNVIALFRFNQSLANEITGSIIGDWQIVTGTYLSGWLYRIDLDKMVEGYGFYKAYQKATFQVAGNSTSFTNRTVSAWFTNPDFATGSRQKPFITVGRSCFWYDQNAKLGISLFDGITSKVYEDVHIYKDGGWLSLKTYVSDNTKHFYFLSLKEDGSVLAYCDQYRIYSRYGSVINWSTFNGTWRGYMPVLDFPRYSYLDEHITFDTVVTDAQREHLYALGSSGLAVTADNIDI